MTPAEKHSLYRRLFRDQLERFYEERNPLFIRIDGPALTRRFARRFARHHALRIMQFWTAGESRV